MNMCRANLFLGYRNFKVVPKCFNLILKNNNNNNNKNYNNNYNNNKYNNNNNNNNNKNYYNDTFL